MSDERSISDQGAGPQLKAASIKFSFKSSTGYSTSENWGPGNNGTAPQVLIAAVDEIARIAALYGFGAEVVAAAQDACRRVAVWRDTDVGKEAIAKVSAALPVPVREGV